jgi:DNA-binding cell septation regulator SpoVG
MVNYSVVIKPSDKLGSLKAFVDLIIDDKLIIHDFKVMETKTGVLFVGPPSKKTSQTDADGNPKYLDTVRFVDASVEKTKENGYKTPWQQEVYDVILDEYRKAVGGKTQSKTSATPAKKPTTKNPLWAD